MQQLSIGTVVLEKNREDRPRFVNLVTYEQRWVPVSKEEDPSGEVEALKLVPVRRQYQWVRHQQGEGASYMCTRVTEVKWKDLKAQPAHREFLEAWMGHVKAQLARIKRGGRAPARKVTVEVVE
jgi:hypothetical protein